MTDGRDDLGAGREPAAASSGAADRTPSPDPPANPFLEEDEGSLAATLEEFLGLAKAGRRPSREEFLARHPEKAGELAECLDGLEFVLAAASQVDPSSDEPPGSNNGGGSGSGPLGPAMRLGDFRIFREVGRGGMGVVFEAEQLSLGRRVALKVLPFAAALDPRQRQRFQLEAQAAAHLHHPHIVPVFAVGRDRGVHYYAMQFIEGRSLAAVVRELRSHAEPGPAAGAPRDGAAILGLPDSTASHPKPASPQPSASAIGGEAVSRPASSGSSQHDRAYFLNVARLGQQAASALDHAHGLGVIHRDVKPGNLLLDNRGDLFVTDFGLARVLDEPGVTRTGDLLGTLAYMSPEQALGRHEADQRSDLYSLGATLYEILTLRPPFEGRDRQELLRKIAHDEPTRPRRLNPAIPRDLETIVLKAMEKDPNARYPNTRELADELGRFLADQPIQARRPGPIEQAAKWARRHRPVVVTATTVLMLAMLVGTTLMVREKQQTERARQDLRSNFLRMVDIADSMTLEAMGLASAGTAQGSGSPATKTARDIFTKAREFYELAASQPQTDEEMRALVAHANHRLAFTRAVMMIPGFDETFALSVRQHEKLVAERRDVAKYRLSLAYTLNDWAMMKGISSGLDAAEPYYLRARQLRREVALVFPVRSEDLVNLCLYETDWAFTQESMGRAEKAREARESLLAYFRILRKPLPEGSATKLELAGVLASQGKQLVDRDRRRDAEVLFRAALELMPGHDIATNNLAWVLVARPHSPPYDPAQAVALAEEAISMAPRAGVLWNTLGVAYYRAGMREKAELAFGRSMELRNGGDPNDWLFLAMCRLEEGKVQEARELFDRSQAWMARNPDLSYDPDLQAFLREAAGRLGLPEPPTPPARKGIAVLSPTLDSPFNAEVVPRRPSGSSASRPVAALPLQLTLPCGTVVSLPRLAGSGAPR